MVFSFVHPKQAEPVEADSPDQLVAELAKLDGKNHVIFLNPLFPIDVPFLNKLSNLFHTEKLPERLTFEAIVPAQDFNEEACKYLKKLGFIQITVPLLFGEPTQPHQTVLQLSRLYDIRVTVELRQPEPRPPLSALARTYWFIQNNYGLMEVTCPQELSDKELFTRFHYLIKASKNICNWIRHEDLIQQQAYTFLYQWLSTNLPPNVKTILEINPFADRSFYKTLQNQPLPWKVSVTTLPGHDLDYDSLKKMNKTFDAIILFHSLEQMTDPQKAMLLLQKYARPTTQWIFLSFNIRTIPTLVHLLMNQWDNALAYTPIYRWMKFYSQRTLEKLFQVLCLNLTIHPLKGPIDEVYQKSYENIKSLIDSQPAQQEFDDHSNVQAYLGIGMMAQLEESEQDTGFITSGFLNSF